MFSNKKIRQLTVKNCMVLITYAVFIIFLFVNLKAVFSMIGTIMSLISPFLMAIGIAYVFNLPLSFYLKKLPEKMKGRKAAAATLALATIVIFIIFIVQIVAPQLGTSIRALIDSVPMYIDESAKFLSELSIRLDLSPEILAQINSYVEMAETWLIELATTLLPKLLVMGKGFTNGIVNLFMSFVIAVYLTLSKTKLLDQLNTVFYAFLPDTVYAYVRKTGTLANATFSNFISGQCLEAVIIGVLCYFGCLVLKIPYAPIIGVVVGLTNIIPIFGPIIGTIFCGFLVLFVSPIKAVIFVVFGICLQQFESNLIYPKVVGTSVGLSGLWVLFAITVGGGLFGLMGMLLGLPTFAIIYRLFGDEVHRRIRLKKAKLAQAELSDEEEIELIEEIVD